ncbi:MAG: 2-amino-4-hydroxy-6-hydroxymethyldihydropteridine diphosphokinase [Rickettsiales bacterium]|nr:2-amino-4-hydroxy-6-hydroxymethyldihydropteridine diphosphokinase [Rickettsiales bacterium]
MKGIYLGLGSNLGDRAAHIARAIAELDRLGVRVVQQAPIYESPAMLPANAPGDWDIAFLNTVIEVQTDAEPLLLLEKVKEVEAACGRQTRGRWGPREIDVDILSYGMLSLTYTELSLPHPGMHERDFVLLPLRDIAPDWRHPGQGEHLGKRVESLIEALPSRSAVLWET